MGGLCGAVKWDGADTGPAVDAMSHAAPHRGSPATWSAAGVTTAGQSTSGPTSGNNPLHDEQSGITVVAEVRLDNRDELTRELGEHDSDVSLVLAAYRRWGDRTAEQLLGDFALVCYDARRRAVYAARDALGLRPLYYHASPDLLLFASEVQQILAGLDFAPALYEPAVACYLAGFEGLPSWTFYDGVSQLPPGHALSATAQTTRTWRYWDIDPSKRIRYRDLGQYDEQFREVFLSAVRSRLEGQTHAGISLSGGLDSGSVAATAGWMRENGQLNSAASLCVYSLAFEEFQSGDERHISDRIAHRYRIHARYLPADDAWPLKDYPAHGPDPDEPFIWPFQPSMDRTFSAAQADGIALLLTGDRGDELVGDWVFDLVGLLRRGRLVQLMAELRAYRTWSGLSPAAALRRQLLAPIVATARGSDPSPTVRHARTCRWPPWLPRDWTNRTHLREIVEQSLPSPPMRGHPARERYHRIFSPAAMRIARNHERMCARYGLVYAEPWADRRLVEFVLAIPQWVVQQVRAPKGIARRAMRGIMPEDARALAGKIEPHALFDHGLRAKERETVFDLLHNSQAEARGFIHAGAVRDVYESYLSGKTPRHDFWWPLTLEMWLRQHWT